MMVDDILFANVLFTLIIMLPLAGLGMWKLMQFLQDKLKIRKGFYRVTFRMSNHRKISRWIKPDKSYIKYKDKVYPFSDKAGLVFYSGLGGIPEIEYNEFGDQINFIESDKSAMFDPNTISLMAIRMFNLGKKAAKTSTKDMLFMVSVIGAGSSVITMLLLFSFIQGA